MNLALPLNIEYKKTLNYLIIAYAFCLPLSKAGISLFGILLILFWLLEANFKEKYNEIKKSKVFLALFAFIGFSILSIFWSSDTLFALDYVQKYWHLLIMVIIYNSLRAEYIKYIFSAFLLGMFISEIVSYGIFFEIWTKEGVSPHDPSPFMDHTNYSVYLAFTVFILMHRILFEETIKWKIIYGFFMMFSMSNMLINGGRTGQIAFFVTLVVMALLNIKHKLRAIIGSITVSSILFMSAYSISPVFHSRMNYTFNDLVSMKNDHDFSGSISARVGLWITGVKAIPKDLIWGTGIGDEKINAKENIEKYELYNFSHARTKNYIDFHNAFIQYGVQLGIIGLLLFSLIFIFFIQQKIKIQVYRNLNIIFVFLFVLLSFVGSSLHIMASMVLFALFGGIFSAISKIENERR